MGSSNSFLGLNRHVFVIYSNKKAPMNKQHIFQKQISSHSISWYKSISASVFFSPAPNLLPLTHTFFFRQNQPVPVSIVWNRIKVSHWACCLVRRWSLWKLFIQLLLWARQICYGVFLNPPSPLAYRWNKAGGNLSSALSTAPGN